MNFYSIISKRCTLDFRVITQSADEVIPILRETDFPIKLKAFTFPVDVVVRNSIFKVNPDREIFSKIPFQWKIRDTARGRSRSVTLRWTSCSNLLLNGFYIWRRYEEVIYVILTIQETVVQNSLKCWMKLFQNILN